MALQFFSCGEKQRDVARDRYHTGQYHRSTLAYTGPAPAYPFLHWLLTKSGQGGKLTKILTNLECRQTRLEIGNNLRFCVMYFPEDHTIREFLVLDN